MAEEIENVTIELDLRDAASAGIARVEAAFESLGNVAQKFNQITAGLSGPLAQIAGGFGLYEVITKSMDAAKAADQTLARLRTVTGSDSAVKQIQDLVKSLSDKSVFGGTSLLSAAADLLTRGVSQSQLPAALRASVELAATLRVSLDEAAQSVAATFGGKLLRGLSQAVPELGKLTQEALKLGGAVEIINGKFAGQAAAQAETPFGAAAKQANALEDQYVDLGNQLVKIEGQILPGFIELFKSLNEALASPAGQGFVGWLTRALPIVLRLGLGVAAISTAVRLLGPAREIAEGFAAGVARIATATEAAAAGTEKLTAAQQRMQARQAAARNLSIAGGLATAAGGTLGYLADGGEGAAIGATLGAASGSFGPLGTAIFAGAALGSMIDMVAARFGLVDKSLGTFDGQLKLLKDTLDHFSQDKETPWYVEVFHATRDFLDQQSRIDDATGFHQGPAVPRGPAGGVMAGGPISPTEADQLIAAHNAKLLQEREALDKQFAQLETETGKRTQDDIEKSDIESNRRKLDARVIGLKQYLATEYQLTSGALDRQMAADQAAIHRLDEQQLRDYASGLTANAQQEQERRNELLREYNDLLKQSGELHQQQAQEALVLSQRQADIAGRELERQTGVNRGLVGRGIISPEQGLANTLSALDQYQASIAGVRNVLQGLAQQPGDIGAAARQAISELDAQAEDIAAKTKAAVSDVRSVAEAAHDAAVSFQEDVQKRFATFLTDIETRVKSVRKAFADLAKGIGEDYLKLQNQRIAEELGGLLSGGSSGGGASGVAGKAASAPGSVLGTVLGWLGKGIGSLFGGGGGGGGGASASVGMGGGFEDFLGMMGYASGGYTGPGPAKQIAGAVHRGEYVVPSSVVQNMGGPASVERAIVQAVRGSRPSGASVMARVFSGSSGGSALGGGGDLTAAAAHLRKTAEAISSAPAATVLPAVPVSEDLVQQIANHPSSARAQVDLMLRNPSVFGPAVKALSKQ